MTYRATFYGTWAGYTGVLLWWRVDGYEGVTHYVP